jgi:hypothetical protein
MTEPSPQYLNIRVRPDLVERVRAWAERERRTLNASANLLIERALDAEERGGRPA